MDKRPCAKRGGELFPFSMVRYPTLPDFFPRIRVCFESDGRRERARAKKLHGLQGLGHVASGASMSPVPFSPVRPIWKTMSLGNGPSRSLN